MNDYLWKALVLRLETQIVTRGILIPGRDGERRGGDTEQKVGRDKRMKAVGEEREMKAAGTPASLK